MGALTGTRVTDSAATVCHAHQAASETRSLHGQRAGNCRAEHATEPTCRAASSRRIVPRRSEQSRRWRRARLRLPFFSQLADGYFPAAPVAAGQSGCRRRQRTQGERDVLQRNGTGAVPQIPKGSKIKNPFQYSIRIREKTILRCADYAVSCVTRDRKDIASHRSEFRAHMLSHTSVPWVGASRHAGAAVQAALRPPEPFVLRGCVHRVVCCALLSAWSVRDHPCAQSACRANGRPAMLA